MNPESFLEEFTISERAEGEFALESCKPRGCDRCRKEWPVQVFLIYPV
jgi:hypothetical protein